MKILFVVSQAIEINSSSSIRNAAIINGLIELGHEVELLASKPNIHHPNYDDSLLSSHIKVKYINVTGMQSIVHIINIFPFVKHYKAALSKALSKFKIYDNLSSIINYLDQVKLNEEHYDLIISSSDPKSSHLVVEKLIEMEKYVNIPWIQIWGDPFLQDITRRNDILRNKIKQEEQKLLGFADKVIYVSPSTLKEQRKLYPEYAEKMNFVYPPFLKNINYLETNLTKRRLKIFYGGDYSPNIRNILPLYEAAQLLDVELTICGDGNLKLKSNSNVTIYPRVSFEKLKQFEAESDIVIHLSNLRGAQIPGKIYQYFGTNKPILFILDGNTETLIDIFGKYNRCVFVKNNVNDIINVVTSFCETSQNVVNRALDDFSPFNVAKRIVSIIEH